MKPRTLFLLLIALLGARLLKCQIDCLDNSWHLKRKNDDKSYHQVADCNCPCDSYKAQGLYTPQRNRCLECRHFHDPNPQIISFKQGFPPQFTLSPLLLNKLISRWKVQS